MNEFYDIWPYPNGYLSSLQTNSFDRDYIADLTTKIENCIDDRGRAVLFPSCRAGLYSILELLGASRNWHIGISEWSSHCVIETVGRLSMPIASGLEGCKCLIVNHQWGFVKKTDSSVLDGIILIEDSCDSIIETPQCIFPNDGRFECFSLPKILATYFGGVVTCKELEDANNLRIIRNNRSIEIAHRQFDLKEKYYKTRSYIDYEYWNNTDAINGFLPGVALEDILRKVKDIGSIIDTRKKRLNSIACCGMNMPKGCVEGRYPSVYPLRFNQDVLNDLESYGISVPIRHFDFACSVNAPKYEKCIAIPLHQGVSDDVFSLVLKTVIKNRVNKQKT